MEKLKFSVEDISNIQDSEDKNFSNLELSLFASGQNLHSAPVSEETLRRCSPSAYNIPIVWEEKHGDIGTHSEFEIPCGFLFENNNPLRFEKMADGRVMLKMFGKIWKRYSGKLMQILKNRGGNTAVSVEMDVLDFDNNTREIRDFSFNCVTLLGDFQPAIPEANALVLSFSKDKEEYYKMFEDKKTYKIDLSKESAFMKDEKYSNPGRQLYGKMLSAANAKQLVDAGYLIVESGWETSPSTKLKYPVAKWRGDTLCLSKPALEAANSRMQAQHVTGEPLNKLKRYYKRLGLSTDSFSTDFEDKEDKNLDEKVIMEQMEPEKEMPKEEMAVEEPEKEMPEKEEEKAAVEEEKEPEKEPEKEDEFGCGKAEYEQKISEYEKKFSEQEAELSELRKFKSDREEQDKTFALEKLFSEVGESLSKEKLEEFRGRSETIKFSDVPAFSNEVKAATFDVVKNSTSEDSVKRMAKLNPAKAEKKSPWSF